MSGSTSAAQSTQEVSSDQEIIDVNNLKSSPSSPRLKISRLRPNDYRHDEQRFQTIIYHNLRIEPLFTCVVPNQVYGAKVITSVLLDYFSAIYYVYASFLIQLTEIIKTLIVFVYFASYLWRCYSETRGLHTANSAATSSSS